MKLSTCIVTLLSSVAAAAPANAALPSSISISNIVYGGSGCPQGSAAVTINPNSLTLDFTRFAVGIGGSASISDNRKNCQLNVAVIAPARYRWTLSKDTYSGYVNIDAGIGLSMKTTVYFSGRQDQVRRFLPSLLSPLLHSYVTQSS